MHHHRLNALVGIRRRDLNIIARNEKRMGFSNIRRCGRAPSPLIDNVAVMAGPVPNPRAPS